MKTFGQIVKSILMSWGIAAAVVAVFSLVRPDRVDLGLLRILLLETGIVAAMGQLLFGAEGWGAGLWTRRIILMLAASVLGIAGMVLAGLRPLTWQLCVLMPLGCIGVSAVVYCIADAVERRVIGKINRKLKQSE